MSKRFSIIALLFLFSFSSISNTAEDNKNKEEKEIKVEKHVTYSKSEKLKQENHDEQLVGKFALSGNSIVFTRSKSLENKGKLFGYIESFGEDAYDNSYVGSILTDTQGNGVASTAFSSFNNKTHVNRKMPNLDNNGIISGKAYLEGGDAEVNGQVEGTVTGNGVSVYGLADYGVILGSDGAGSSLDSTSVDKDSDDSKDIDGKAGASKVKVKEKHKEKHKDKHKEGRKEKYKEKHKDKHKEKNKSGSKIDGKGGASVFAGRGIGSNTIGIDGKAGASVGVFNSAGVISSDDGLVEIDKIDLTGKNAEVTIENLSNSAVISGNIRAVTSDGYLRAKADSLGAAKVEEHMQPQWRSTLFSSSGNGISSNTVVTSPTRQNFSTEAKNITKIDRLTNSGIISGHGEFESGDMATVNYVNSYSTGNGVSLSAFSHNNVGHYTEATLGEINNTGKITGFLKQNAGENTGSGWHEYSNSVAQSSGNGISLSSRSANAKNEMTKASIKNLNNSGVISGEIYTSAGLGNGEVINRNIGSGNGVSVYAIGGTERDASIDNIINRGKIIGKAIIYGGKDISSGYVKKEKKFFVDIVGEEPTKEADLRYEFTEEEKVVGTKIFEENQANERKKLTEKIDDFKEVIEENEERFKSLKKEIIKKEEVLGKIASSYIENLEENKRRLESELETTKERAKWSSDKKYYELEIERLEKKINTQSTEIENYKNRNWEDVAIEKSLKFYDDKITKLEEQIDIKNEEKEKEIAKYAAEIKKINKEIEDAEKEETNEYYYTEEDKAKELKRLNDKKEIELKRFEEKKEELTENFEMEKSEIEKKIELLKNDLKDENIQEFLAIYEGREYSEKTIAHLEKLKDRNENRENPMTRKKDHAENTIHTESEVFATGNGISIYQEGTKRGETLKYFENEGVISGYTEVYRGASNGEFSRVAYRSSGAGLSIKGKMSSEVKNAGILSGSDFAILSEGVKDDTQGAPKYYSGFSKVSNYGILAGRVIGGGYYNSSVAKQDYEYFETIESDKDKYNNYGIYLTLDKEGNISEVIEGDKTGLYNEKEIKNILGTDENSFISKEKIENKIVNGVGAAGVVVAENKTEINNSIINGFYKAIKVKDNASVSLNESIINANGFGERSYAIVGTDGDNKLVVDEESLINGRINLGKGNDYLSLSGNNIFSDIDLGEGKNTLQLYSGNKENGVKYRTVDKNHRKIFKVNVKNATNLVVNNDTQIKEISKISGIKNIEVPEGKKLIYEISNKDNQPFYDFVEKEGNIGVVKLNGGGEFLIDDETLGYSKSGNSDEILGWKLLKDGKEVYVESEKIFDTRKKLGISKKDYVSMTDNKVINMENTEKVLDAVFRNKIPYQLASYVLGVTERNKNIVSTEFLDKNKYNILLNTFDTSSSDNNIKASYNEKSVILDYGLFDNVNVGFNLGKGSSKAKFKDKSTKEDILNAGFNLKYKKGNLIWSNGFSYSKSNYFLGSALYSDIRYGISLYDWKIVPFAGAAITKLTNYKNTEKISDEYGKKIGEIFIPKQNIDYSEWNFGINLSNKKYLKTGEFIFDIGGEYFIRNKIGTMKATQTEKSNFGEFKNNWNLNTPKLKNKFNGFIGMKYAYNNGLSLNIELKINNSSKDINLGIGYKF